MSNKLEIIPDKILNLIAEKMEANPQIKENWRLKLEEQKTLFLTSQAVVYCEDCQTVFFYGNAESLLKEAAYVDWKLLSFRHVWDTRHKVKIYLPYFLAGNQMILKDNPLLAGIVKNMRKQIGFDENEQFCFYKSVEAKREQLSLMGSKRANLSHDANWGSRDRVQCSVCHTAFSNPKDACMCHSESKQWLPLSEVESIRVGV